MIEEIIRCTIDEEIKLFAIPQGIEKGYEVLVEINLLDKDRNILKTILPKGVKVEKNIDKEKYGDSENIILCKFVINELSKDIKVEEVKYVTGWIDSKDKEVSIEYDEVSVLEVVDCYCNRDFTVEEIKDIIKELRDSEETTKGNYDLFTAENCKLPQNERTYERFTEELNKTFRKYEINTCLRKIHFLAQAYVESAYFQTTEEFGSEQYLKGKKYYPYYGRGLLQLTWDFNVAKYYDYNYNTKYFQRYIKYLDENKLNQENTRLKDCINKKLKNGTECLSQSDYSKIQEIYRRISSNLENTLDSSGWFWRKGSAWGDLNKSSDIDDIYYNNIGINGGFNHFAERIKYAKKLILISQNLNCLNIKLTKPLGKYSLSNSNMINTLFIKRGNNKSKMETFDDK